MKDPQHWLLVAAFLAVVPAHADIPGPLPPPSPLSPVMPMTPPPASPGIWEGGDDSDPDGDGAQSVDLTAVALPWVDDTMISYENGSAPFYESQPVGPGDFLLPASQAAGTYPLTVDVGDDGYDPNDTPALVSPDSAFSVPVPLPLAPSPGLAANPFPMREVISLWNFDTSIKNQGRLPTCSTFAMVAAMENLYNQANGNPVPEINLSEWQLWNLVGRQINPSEKVASAAMENWIVPEWVWPYRQAAPAADLVTNGWVSIAQFDTTASKIQTMSSVLAALRANSRVILTVGTNTSWDRRNRGVLTTHGSAIITGGENLHDVEVVGYVRSRQRIGYLVFKNSWGSRWGDGGYGYLPLSYCRSWQCWALSIDRVQVNE